MRIEAYTQVQQMYKPAKANQVASKSNVGEIDKVQISTLGKDILNAKQAVANASDVREDVIAPLKASIQAGTYQVSGESFTDKLLKKFEEVR